MTLKLHIQIVVSRERDSQVARAHIIRQQISVHGTNHHMRLLLLGYQLYDHLKPNTKAKGKKKKKKKP